MKFHVNSPLVLIGSYADTFKMEAKYLFYQQAPIFHRKIVPNKKYQFLQSLYYP
jgi:hypothetical protein